MLNPLLNMEVVEIPSTGEVYFVEGNPEIKKARATGYSAVVTGQVVDSEDILWLKKWSVVGIKLNDTSYVLNDPQDEDVFITFDFIESKKH